MGRVLKVFKGVKVFKVIKVIEVLKVLKVLKVFRDLKVLRDLRDFAPSTLNVQSSSLNVHRSTFIVQRPPLPNRHLAILTVKGEFEDVTIHAVEVERFRVLWS